MNIQRSADPLTKYYEAMLLIWALLEASEITRLNTNVEEDNTPAVAECGSKKGRVLSLL
jgi:hypothetical protein